MRLAHLISVAISLAAIRSTAAQSPYPQLFLGQWHGITPVILPVGPQTLPCIGVASAGVAVPFFLFLIAMFYLLVPLWLHNFHSDSAAGGAPPMSKYVSPTMEEVGGGRGSGLFQVGDEEGGAGLVAERYNGPMTVQGYWSSRGGQ